MGEITMRGLKWFKVGTSGARFNYIKYLFKLLHSKLFRKKNRNKKESNNPEINEKKIDRNKFGFPVFK